MKCLLDNCPKELAQLTALTLIVGVGWVELWECPTHGVYSIPKRGKATMKEVSCDHADECKVEAAVLAGHPHWCHAGKPHPVNESCERSYCREARRQVKCEPIPAPVLVACLKRDVCVDQADCPRAEPHRHVGKGCNKLCERWPKLCGWCAIIPAEELAALTTPPETCTRRTRDLCDLSGLPCGIVYDGVTCRRGRPPSPAEVAEADVEEHRYEDARQVWAESQGRLPHVDYKGIPPSLRWMGEAVAERSASQPPRASTATAHERGTAWFRRRRIHSIIRQTFARLHDGTATTNVHIDRAVSEIEALPRPDSADDLQVSGVLKPAPRLCRSCGADLDVWGETLGGPCCEAKQ